MFYLLVLLLNFIMLAVVPPESFQADRTGVILFVGLYFIVLYFFSRQNIVTVLRLKITQPVSIFLASIFLVIISFFIFHHGISIPQLVKVSLIYLIPFLLLRVAKTPAAFHPLDMIIFLTIFLPLELNLVKLPLIYNRNLIAFDAVFSISVLFTVFSYVAYRKIDIGLEFPSNMRKWLETFLLTGLLIAIEIGIGTRLDFLHLAPWTYSLSHVYVLSVFMFFTAAFVEEIFFRGLIYNYLAQYLSRNHKYLPLVVNTLLFGLTHINNGGMPMLLLSSVAGLFYGIVYLRTKNIFYVTAIHALTNICWKLLFV